MNDATFNASREFVRYVAQHGLVAALHVYGMTRQEAKDAILRVRITVALRMAKRMRLEGAVCKAAARSARKDGLVHTPKAFEAISRKAYRHATRYARQAMQATINA